MAQLRAVELGLTLIRPTKDGRTVVIDPDGRVVASLMLADNQVGSLHADVPVGRRFSLYAIIGDVFAWGCVGAFVLLPVIALRRPPAAIYNR
ncbi:MAG: nitrilase-related carbon-nitrogen hydrolase, partial [Planctomycetota bacterium]|jgi:apolipoprotein N-acyltransferase